MLNGRINWTDLLGKLHFIPGKWGKREITQLLLRIIKKNQTTRKQSLHPVRLHGCFKNISCHVSTINIILTVVLVARHLQFFVHCFIHLNFFLLDIYLWTFWIYSACFCSHFKAPVIFHPQITNTCSQHDCRISRAFFSPWYLPCSH